MANDSAEDDFTRKIKSEVEKAKSHEEWRNEYMTLLQRDREKKEEGRLEGMVEAYHKTGMPIQKIANIVNVSVDEVNRIIASLK